MARHDRFRLERLLRKYQLLLELRLEREAVVQRGLERFAAVDVPRRRARMHALAEEFPGSLREMDSSTVARLQQRRDALEAALAHRGDQPAWVLTVDDFHLTLRQALAIKRWLVDRVPRRTALDERLVRDFDHEHPHLPRRLSAADLGVYLRPPEGRLLNLVWAELDERLGHDRAELERDVFG